MIKPKLWSDKEKQLIQEYNSTTDSRLKNKLFSKLTPKLLLIINIELHKRVYDFNHHNDVRQDCLIRIFENLHRIKDVTTSQQYIMQMINSSICDYLRKYSNKEFKGIDALENEDFHNAEEMKIRNLDIEDIVNQIKTISKKQNIKGKYIDILIKYFEDKEYLNQSFSEYCDADYNRLAYWLRPFNLTLVMIDDIYGRTFDNMYHKQYIKK